MQEAWKAWKDGFKRYVWKNNWVRIGGILFLFVLGFVIYKTVISPDITIGEIGNKDVWSDYDNIVEQFSENEVDGVVVQTTTAPTADVSMDSTKIETTVNQFFSAARGNNSNIFTASMSAEHVESDFLKYPLNERFSKIDEAMNRITRNNKLTNVEIVRSIWMLESNTSRIVLDLHYDDLSEPIRVSLIVKFFEEYPFNVSEGDTVKIPYVHSSVWDLIKMIEGE